MLKCCIVVGNTATHIIFRILEHEEMSEKFITKFHLK